MYAADQTNHLDENELTGRTGRLARGTWEQRHELDAAIGSVSTRWRVERMPPVDRNVLRLALYELRNEPDVPTAVIISEAVELAKEYSTERSGAFVNGILGKLAELER